jgi:hypothetical protein
MKLFGIIFTLFPMVFLGIGGYMAWDQDRKITHYMSVTAKVLSRTIETSTDSEGKTTYKPVVSFEFQVDGNKYTGRDIYPISMSSGHGWAQETINRFKVGSEVEAFCDPANPSSAFLLKEYSFFPYIFIMFPMIFVAIGTTILISAGASATNPALPFSAEKGWFEVRPRKRIASRKKAGIFATVLWFGTGGAAAYHYFSSASAPYGTLAVVATSIYCAIGLIPLGYLVYNHLLGRNVGDARVFVDGQQFSRGSEINVGLRLPVYRPVQVQDASMGLICRVSTKTRRGSKTTYSSHTEHEEAEVVMEEFAARAGEDMEIAHTVKLPDRASPSTLTKEYPRYMWAIRIVVRIKGSPDYRSEFPIIVTF